MPIHNGKTSARTALLAAKNELLPLLPIHNERFTAAGAILAVFRTRYPRGHQQWHGEHARGSLAGHPAERGGRLFEAAQPSHVAKMQHRVARRQHRPIHLIGRGLRPTRNPQMQNGVTIVNIGWSPRRSRAGTKLGRLKLSRCDWGTYASTTAGSTQGARWHGICCLSHRRMGFS